MSYVDGFVIAVPTARKQQFIEHAAKADSMFLELGATRILECWGDDVPDGKLTDFRRAVQAKDDETVVFSWIEWPDKSKRDAAMGQMEELAKSDDRISPAANPMPFDGKRMVFGGFAPVVTLPTGNAAGIQPYLFFRGRCEEAIEYYQRTLGAEVLMMMRFRENPDTPGHAEVPPVLADKIMHASLRIRGTSIMMSDGMKSGPLDFKFMSLALSVPTEADADRVFESLAAEGTVDMPIGKTFFSPRFGAVTDKFGVSWMVVTEPPQQA